MDRAEINKLRDIKLKELRRGKPGRPAKLSTHITREKINILADMALTLKLKEIEESQDEESNDEE